MLQGTIKQKEQKEKELACAEAHADQGPHGTRTSGDDKPPGPILVEDGADVDAAEEGQPGVYGEDPADGGLVVAPELVAEHVSLEEGDGVHEPEGGEEGEPRAEDDEPGAQAALGIGLGSGGG